jgi:hypothetical protein
MSTYSAHCLVTSSDHPLNGGLAGYYQGLVPQVARASSYDPKFCIQPVPSRLKRRGHQLKKN